MSYRYSEEVGGRESGWEWRIFDVGGCRTSVRFSLDYWLWHQCTLQFSVPHGYLSSTTSMLLSSVIIVLHLTFNWLLTTETTSFSCISVRPAT